MRWLKRVRALTACAAVAGVLVTASIVHAEEKSTVRLAGSKYAGFYVQDLSQDFYEKNKDLRVIVSNVEVWESLTGLKEGRFDGVLVFGKLQPDLLAEARNSGMQLREQILGGGGVAVIVRRDNPIKALTLDQVRRIFTGEIENWKEAGGPDQPITVITRDESLSGIENFVRSFLLQGFPYAASTLRIFNHDVVRAVWKTEGSVADARLTEALPGQRKGYVKVPAIKPDADSPPVKPSKTNVRNRSYPLSGPFVLYSNSKTDNPNLEKFARFAEHLALSSRLTEAK